MTRFSPFSVSPMETVSPVLPIAIALATGLVVLSALAAVALHVAAAVRDRRRAATVARLEPILLHVLSEAISPRSLAARVRPHEEVDFLHLLIRYGLRLRGSSRQALTQAARPFVARARDLMRSRSAERRMLGVQVLGLLGQHQDRALLIAALDDPSHGVAMMAARALSRTGDVGVLPALITSLHRFEAWGTPAVASMLAQFGIHGGGLLALRLIDPAASEPLRVACAEALRRIGYEPAVAAVETLLHRRTPTPREVRAAVLRLVATIGTDAQAPTVRALLDDPDPVVRLHAITALGVLGDPFQDAPALADALSDPNTWASLRAAHALRRLDRRDVLEQAAQSDDARGRLARQTLAA